MSDYLNTDRSQGCILNYSGGKHRYFSELKSVLPDEMNLKVCDVFCGGGSIATSLPSNWLITANDKEQRIIDIHKTFEEVLVNSHGSIDSAYTYLSQYCLSQVSDNKDESGFELLKKDYNTGKNPLALYALATSSNSNYIRFNNSGEFNVKFGKRYFNANLQVKLYNYLERVSKRKIQWLSSDFRDINFNKFDLLVVDSPYSYNNKSTATYNEKGGWQLQDLVSLLTKLDKYHEAGGRFIFFNEIVTKGEDNLIIQSWANKYNVNVLRDTLTGCSYQRTKDRSVEVMVTSW